MNELIDLEKFKARAQQRKRENKKFLDSLKKKDPRKTDDWFHRTHDAVFDEIDCLKCANCCKTTSPIFYQADIERLAKHLRIKPGDFIQKYLLMDEDHDFVLNQALCPFLAADNTCAVYDYRPKACREYPHTNRRKMVQLLELTYKNTLVCPAVLEIVERLKQNPSLTK